MPLRYDPLLCRSLALELGRRHRGRRLRDLLLNRDRRLATIRFREDPGLLALLHPEAGQVVETEAAHGEASVPLDGQRLERVFAPDDERMLVLEAPPAGPEGATLRIVLELMTNQWNLVLVRKAEDEGRGEDGGGDGGDAEGAGWRVRAALWPREAGDRVLRPGRPYRPPRGDRRWREETPTAEAWRDLLADVPPPERRGTALRSVAWLSGVNVEHVLGAAAAGDDPEALEAARERYLALRDAEPEAWLLEEPTGLQPYVRSLGREDARRTASLLAGMRASLAAEEGWSSYAAEGDGAADGGEPVVERESPELAELREALEARAARVRRRVEALERELAEGRDPEALRGTADLILARLGSVERGREEVELEGFDGEPRTVELDPSLSPSDNAERYYEEAARRERAREKIPLEVERAEEVAGRIDRALEGIEERRAEGGGALDEETVERLWRLAGGRPGERAAGGEEGERLPYRRLLTSGGLEVRVGRGAKSNEELTFHHSHTEDVWLHARQVPGAHVILRWGHREGNPPRSDLLQAAVAAAVHSDARHSGSVAVDWTRRKYVRSPRKSAPGAVIPRNVQTLFVEPDEAVVERMRRRAEGG